MKPAAELHAKLALLYDTLNRYSKIAVAFSGGIDSTLLLKVAYDQQLGQVIAFFADSIVQPRGEREAAVALAKNIGSPLHVVEFDILASPQISENSSQRCYFCKKKIFSEFLSLARQQGCDVLLDGTNLDDNPADRPGAKASRELGVKSPLRAAGFTKKDIRALAKQLGLANWNRPSASCLATRVATGVKISTEQLALIDTGERFLHSLDLYGCRMRVDGKKAFIELCKGDIAIVTKNNHLPVIRKQLADLGFDKIYLDLAERDSGTY